MCLQELCRGVAAGDYSCCTADDTFADGWCRDGGSASHPAFTAICEPRSDAFGWSNFVLGDDGDAVPADTGNWQAGSELVPFCDVLGAQQRRWLQWQLYNAPASVNIVVAPGGLLGNPSSDAGNAEGGCTGTEWDCYRPAQVNLLHTLSNATGCTVVLSGAPSTVATAGVSAGTSRARAGSCCMERFERSNAWRQLHLLAHVRCKVRRKLTLFGYICNTIISEIQSNAVQPVL